MSCPVQTATWYTAAVTCMTCYCVSAVFASCHHASEQNQQACAKCQVVLINGAVRLQFEGRMRTCRDIVSKPVQPVPAVCLCGCLSVCLLVWPHLSGCSAACAHQVMHCCRLMVNKLAQVLRLYWWEKMDRLGKTPRPLSSAKGGRTRTSQILSQRMLLLMSCSTCCLSSLPCALLARSMHCNKHRRPYCCIAVLLMSLICTTTACITCNGMPYKPPVCSAVDWHPASGTTVLPSTHSSQVSMPQRKYNGQLNLAPPLFG